MMLRAYRRASKTDCIFGIFNFSWKEDVNVVVVDWQNGANTQGNYDQAAANTRVVGALTANLMTSLFTSASAKYEDMYIVGFSLGAHIAGYAGERVPNLGRITGIYATDFL